jgi:hypothetical protein
MWNAVSGKFYQRIPPGVINIGSDSSDSVAYKGEEHYPNSSLLVVEGCVEDTCDCATRYYRWTGRRFQLILRQSVRVPAKCLSKQ